MSILCKIGLHNWRYNSRQAIEPFTDIKEITRHCLRCEKIERALQFLPPSPLFPPKFKDMKKKP